ncbi:MAG: hypothetical protein WDZ43_04935 [Nitrosopumilaceae archaeon]
MPELLRSYYQSKLADKKEISKYIDQIHGGTDFVKAIKGNSNVT